MSASEQGGPSPRLRTAIVVRPREDTCQVVDGDRLTVVTYSVPFRPRADRLTPGQLVALASAADGADMVVWRWFDGVVVEAATGQITLWEPAHGEVLAQPRDQQRRYLPGSRAYLSAGLPGADWWVAGPVAPAGTADVELEEVHDFYTRHDLWSARA